MLNLANLRVNNKAVINDLSVNQISIPQSFIINNIK